MARFKRILITGAAGALGTLLRRELAPLAEVLRLSDKADLGVAAAHEELVHCDLAQLVSRALLAPKVGFSVVYGSSANREQFWDNRYATHIGYLPQDSAEPYRDKVEAATPVPDPEDPAVVYVGGGFAAAGHFEGG